MTPADLRGHVAARVPGYMVPQSITVIDELPLTPSGKLDRAALPAPELLASAGYRAPVGPAEVLVCNAFGATLGLDRVGADDNFFELGGNSLLATQVAARLGAALNARVPVRLLFEAPNVAALAARMESHAGTGARRALVAGPRPDTIPLSLAQQRMWFLNRFDAQSAAYNVPIAVRLTGSLDLDALRLAVGDIVARHETLRTVFPEVEGNPEQRVLDTADAAVTLFVATVTPDEVTGAVRSFAAPGFDLAEEVPLRAALITVSDRPDPDGMLPPAASVENVLVLVVHHIAMDGWSLEPLAADVALAYRAACAGAEFDWPEPQVQYADYT
ncbi:condensation domain-containing protein, partial [Streptomyces roseolus]|uniref:condensation domain-containing protein n=1 Tax=Streptomyces roseolus TaxID=67358 RepID=UPI003663ACFE